MLGSVGVCMSVRACSPTHPTCNAHAPSCHPRPLASSYFRHCHDFRERKLLIIKCVFWFSLQLLFEVLLILKRNERDIVIIAEMYSYKVPIILVTFCRQISQGISNFIQIRSVTAEIFHADGHEEADSCFANSRKIGYPRLFLLICQAWFFSRVAKQSHLREINLVSQTPLLNAKFKKCGNGLY